jgi:hypothetical protein
MAWVGITVTNAPWASTTAKLDGVNYGIETYYNTRAGAFFLNLLDEDGNILKAGIKVVVSFPLTGFRDTDPRMPPGMLYAYDTSGQDLDPTLDDFGTRVLLLYEELGTVET